MPLTATNRANILAARVNRLNASIRRLITCADIVRQEAYPKTAEAMPDFIHGIPKGYRVQTDTLQTLHACIVEYEAACDEMLTPMKEDHDL